MINHSKEVKDVYNTTVKGGFPSPALDYLEENIDLNKELIDHPLSTFLMQYNLPDMTQAYIPSGAKLVVDRSATPENGSLVVCAIGSKFRVRFLKKNNHKAWLLTGNRQGKEMDITGRNDVEIWGVVTNILIPTQNVRSCMP